jgi:hypothetical protein
MRFDSRVLQVCLIAAGLAGCRTTDGVFLPALNTKDKRLTPERIEVSRALSRAGGTFDLDFVFKEAGMRPVSVHFEVDESSFDAVDRAWGYRDTDLARLKDSFEASRSAAFEAAQARQDSQSNVDAEMKTLQAGFEKSKRDYILSRGFRFLPDRSVEADMSALVRANAARLAPLTLALERGAKNAGRPRSWIIAAAAAMTQTALDYRDVPDIVDGVHTGGVWPPIGTLVYGWGDCDTKSALLAAILANLPGMHILGIETSSHYLLAISKKPAKGEAYIKYKGRKFVLLEPAGPGLLAPGTIAEATKLLFGPGRAYKVERLF